LVRNALVSLHVFGAFKIDDSKSFETTDTIDLCELDEVSRCRIANIREGDSTVMDTVGRDPDPWALMAPVRN